MGEANLIQWHSWYEHLLGSVAADPSLGNASIANIAATCLFAIANYCADVSRILPAADDRYIKSRLIKLEVAVEF